MAALYAFCREVDDVADEDALPEAERRRRLQVWRSDIRSACERGVAELPVNRELVPVIARYRLRFEHFDELLQGVEMDLETRRYATYEALEAYCYRVASVVGLLSIEIFGYRNPRCHDYAVALGKALQFTNILRDVRNDAERGRVYLPAEALARAGVDAESVLRLEDSEGLRRAAAEVADRARAFFSDASAALPAEDRGSMVAAELMGAVYWQLLGKIQRGGFQVMQRQRARVGRPAKLALILRTWIRISLGSNASNYG